MSYRFKNVTTFEQIKEMLKKEDIKISTRKNDSINFIEFLLKIGCHDYKLNFLGVDEWKISFQNALNEDMSIYFLSSSNKVEIVHLFVYKNGTQRHYRSDRYLRKCSNITMIINAMIQLNYLHI